MSLDSYEKTVQLDSDRQVLEISNGTAASCVEFTVETQDATPFEFAVVNTKSLNREEFEYNNVDKGYIFGNVKDIVVPTYLVLKSSIPCQAKITIKRKLSGKVKTPTSGDTGGAPTTDGNKPFYARPLVWVGVIVVCAVLYWMYRNSKNTTGEVLEKSADSSLASIDENPAQSGFGF